MSTNKSKVEDNDLLPINNIFDTMSYEDVQKGIDLILKEPRTSDSMKESLLSNLWKVNFEVKPPTMEEFLTPKYLGAVADNLFPHVKKVLIGFMNPLGIKRVLALSTAIGWGKSSASSILILYIIVQLQYMKDPKKYYNLNEMGSLVIALLSFTLKKAGQLLLQPFNNLLKSSPIFHRVTQEDRLNKKQKELPKGHIAYTSAGRMGALQFSKDIHITVVSDRANLLGLNVIAGVCSEISFFAQRGVPPEEIWGTFTDLRERINSRFSHAYLTATILDSSPLDIDLSPIDKWLYSGEAEKDEEVTFINAKHWEVFPEKYPKWRRDKSLVFPVFRGNASKPPKILQASEEKDYPKDEIYQVPIDKLIAFQQNLKKSIADFCAYPSGGIAKLIDNQRYIDDIFTDALINQYDPISIPEEKNPKGLIWDQLVNRFFINHNTRGNPNYEFWRNPKEHRAIHIDLSETGDISGLTMTHKEYNLKGEEILIHDFNLALHKGESRMNLDAVCEFVIDLRDKGNLNIWKVTADQYQSSALLQRLRREGFDADRFSVDRETGPYLLYSSWVKNGRVKAGKSIHLKNNLRSLIETTREKGSIKIDHIKGQPIYYDDRGWNDSDVGFRAKDISDTACGSSYFLITDYKQTLLEVFDNTSILNDPKKVLEKSKKELFDRQLKIKKVIKSN